MSLFTRYVLVLQLTRTRITAARSSTARANIGVNVSEFRSGVIMNNELTESTHSLLLTSIWDRIKAAMRP